MNFVIWVIPLTKGARGMLSPQGFIISVFSKPTGHPPRGVS